MSKHNHTRGPTPRPPHDPLRVAAELFWSTAAPRRQDLIGLLARREITPAQRSELRLLDEASVAVGRWLEVRNG